MDWTEQLTRIRRWVRDPNGDIFTDPFLLRIYNDEHQQIFSMLGTVMDVKVIRTHPEFQGSYTQDWEWKFSGYSYGDVYQVGLLDDASETVYLNVWEAEQLKAYGATSYEQGDVYTQPWEAWAVSAAWFPPPIPMPENFASAVYVSYDRDRVDPESKREIIRNDDMTWKTRAGGDVWSYWRDSKVNNWIRVYPIPTLTWQDTAYASGDPDEAEYGENTVDVDNNLLVVYTTDPDEILGGSNESTLPPYFHKYVEYGVAERALRANTDGRIESLADYWGLRKKAGYEVIKKWKRLKMSDRNIQFKTQNGDYGRQRQRFPRLPSTYPDGHV